MAEDYIPTVRIRRPAKVTTDDRGRTFWADTVETAELELVSTAELQKILASADEDTRSAIQSIVRELNDRNMIAPASASALRICGGSACSGSAAVTRLTASRTSAR